MKNIRKAQECEEDEKEILCNNKEFLYS